MSDQHNKWEEFCEKGNELIRKYIEPESNLEKKDWSYFLHNRNYMAQTEYALSLIDNLRNLPDFIRAEISCNANNVPYPQWFVSITEKHGDVTGTTFGNHRSLCVAICSAVLKRKNIFLPKEPENLTKTIIK